jgi:hypothetical protein
MPRQTAPSPAPPADVEGTNASNNGNGDTPELTAEQKLAALRADIEAKQAALQEQIEAADAIVETEKARARTAALKAVTELVDAVHERLHSAMGVNTEQLTELVGQLGDALSQAKAQAKAEGVKAGGSNGSGRGDGTQTNPTNEALNIWADRVMRANANSETPEALRNSEISRRIDTLVKAAGFPQGYRPSSGAVRNHFSTGPQGADTDSPAVERTNDNGAEAFRPLSGNPKWLVTTVVSTAGEHITQD